MPRPRKARPNWDEMATIWQVSDELWAVVAPILAELDPPTPTDRPTSKSLRPRRFYAPGSGTRSWCTILQNFPGYSVCATTSLK